MPTNFPTSLDAFPTPTESTYTDDSGFELDVLVEDALSASEALEAKVGVGATTPDAQFKSLIATAAGTSAWGYSSLVKLAEATGTGASGVLAFTSIPANFRALLISLHGRSDAAATAVVARMTFESSPTAGAYNHQQLRGNASSASAIENPGTSDFIAVATITGATGPANTPGVAMVFLPEYAGTSLYKGALALSFGATALSAGGLFVDVFGGVAELTAAISTVRLTLSSGNWTTTSRATLFGLPSA